jgi:hypothetical protein
VSNGGKFKLYTVLNGLLFPTPTQPRMLFERAILHLRRMKTQIKQNLFNRKKQKKVTDYFVAVYFFSVMIINAYVHDITYVFTILFHTYTIRM